MVGKGKKPQILVKQSKGLLGMNPEDELDDMETGTKGDTGVHFALNGEWGKQVRVFEPMPSGEPTKSSHFTIGCCWEAFYILLIVVEWLKSNHLTAEIHSVTWLTLEGEQKLRNSSS